MSSGEGKVVCVTGASGYIASWIVKYLLQHGYTVRATVRDPSNPKKVDHLLELDGAKERLQLFKADLLEEGSFDSAIEGCDGVFHTASPVRFVVNDPQVELLDPAVKGTLNVLKSCVKSPSLWYTLSKVLAEDAAWKFVNEKGIDMVVINPTMVAGPLLQPEVNESVEPILNIINGLPFQNKSMGWVHVKDVAHAHIQAFEIASASGRYCLAERVVHYSELARILHDLYPTLPISHKCENDGPYQPTYQISKQKAKSLGIEFIPLEVTLKETVESFRENKIVSF